jgi:membrane fusion protein, multidrug efflux system
MAIRSSPAKKRNGRIISLAVIAYTLVIGGVALHKANFSPRTDDAEVFANFIGIAPQVDGPIAKLLVRDNQFVKKGDLLLEIDPRPYAYALQHAQSEKDALEGEIIDRSRVIAAQTSGVAVSQAGARNAEANLKKTEATIEEARAAVGNAQAGLARTEADLAYATSNLHRIEPLLAEKFVTVDQVDQARTQEEMRRQAVEQARSQLKLSQAALESMLAQYEQSKAGLDQSREQVQQSMHGVTTLEPLTSQRPGKMSAIETAQYNLNNCRIYAPFDARVTNLTISEGAYAHTGQQIFTLIDTRTWWVIGNYRETQLRDIRPGATADVYLMPAPDRVLHGTVESIGFGVAPDPDVIGRLDTGLPNLQRTLNWVHLASRFPVRIRIDSPANDQFRMGESAVVVVRSSLKNAKNNLAADERR